MKAKAKLSLTACLYAVFLINYLDCGGLPQFNLSCHSFIMNRKYFYSAKHPSLPVSQLVPYQHADVEDRGARDCVVAFL